MTALGVSAPRPIFNAPPKVPPTLAPLPVGTLLLPPPLPPPGVELLLFTFSLDSADSRLDLDVCGFMWLSMCFFTSGSVANLLRQLGIGQQNGRSPWCVLVCWSRIAFCLKSLPHCWHLYGFSPVWMRRCWLRIVLCLKFLPQYTQP